MMDHQMRVVLTIGIVFCMLSVCSIAAESKGLAPEDHWLKVGFDFFHTNHEGEIQPRVTIDLGPKKWSGEEKRLSTGRYALEGDINARLIHAWGVGPASRFSAALSLDPGIRSGYGLGRTGLRYL